VQYLTLPSTAQCAPDCFFTTPAYNNGTVYLGMVGSPVLALTLAGGHVNSTPQQVVVPSSTSAETYGYPGPTPNISGSPNGDIIVWVLDNGGFATSTGAGRPAILRAYDATNLANTLYSSSTLAADAPGNAVKFTCPVIANGHVYVGGSRVLTVFGLSP